MARASPATRDLDKELEALRRVPANRLCPSCPAVAPLGFRDVCVKFGGAFVCGDCKSAHQAFSHRVKSLGQSTFEAAEVDSIARGGNALVAATWLGRLSREQIAAMAPKPGAKNTEWHAWIRRIYEEREFYSPVTQQPQAAPAPGGWPVAQAAAPVAAAPPPLPPRRSTGGPVPGMGSASLLGAMPKPLPPANNLDDLFAGLAQGAHTGSRSLLDDDGTSFAFTSFSTPQPPVAAAPGPSAQLNMDALFGVLPAESREMKAMGSGAHIPAQGPGPFRMLPPPPPGPAVPRLAPPPQASQAQFPRLL
jgi:hypothetical protein